MIELKTLTEEEQHNLVRGCEVYTFKTQNLKWQRSIHNKLIEEFGSVYKIPIQLIITLACKAVKYGLDGGMIPLSNTVYSDVNKKRPTNKINIVKLRELILKMEGSGYLTFYKGYRKTETEGITSCLRFHDKLLDNLNKKYCERWGVSRFDDFLSLEVVDEGLSTKLKKVFKNLRNIRGSKEIRNEVNLVNKELAKHKITYKGRRCCVVYKRRFIEDLYQAGRWYVVGTFQIESAEGRITIMIDDKPTVEIDVDKIHPCILASIAGFVLPEDYDPYDITGYIKTPIDKRVLRDFIKPCFMSLLYSESRHTALYEIREKLKDNKHIANWLDCQTILESLEEHNSMLSDFFYRKDNWKLCQYIDSCIATKIMVHFASKGEVCLNYHDSWVVSYENKQELIDVLTQSWEKVVGNLDNFSYSVEFDNTPTDLK